MQGILAQLNAMIDSPISEHSTEVDVDAVARRAQQLIAEKLEELNAALPLTAVSEASSGGSTPQVGTHWPGQLRLPSPVSSRHSEGRLHTVPAIAACKPRCVCTLDPKLRCSGHLPQQPGHHKILPASRSPVQGALGSFLLLPRNLQLAARRERARGPAAAA